MATPTLSPPTISLALGRFGFAATQTGGHMARSMMVEEMRILCRETEIGANREAIHRAILEDNLLHKPTVASREKTFHHLVELYGLDPRLTLFRVLREFAAQDPESIPLMAMVCCYCRDPQLRHSFELIDTLRAGEALPRERMERFLEEGFPGRFSPAMKKSLAQNVNTTWTGSGHLTGKVRKKRSKPEAPLAAVCYAMLAGYLSGLRGEVLLNSAFARLIGASAPKILSMLPMAQRMGWVRYRHFGGVTEIDFTPLLTPNEQEVLHGTH